MVLSIYFKNKKMKAIVSDCSNIHTADIIFQAICSGVVVAPHPRANKGKPLYFAIADSKKAHLQHLYRGVEKSNILYRHQPVALIFQCIESTIFPQLLSNEQARPSAELFIHEPLTPREHEVLFHLKQGKTPAGAAISMGVKVKTISSHKRAAMKKLNFRRTNELFHWMLQGGLSR